MPEGREAEAVAFYEGLLGIPHVPKPPHFAKRGGCGFETGGLKLIGEFTTDLTSAGRSATAAPRP